MKTNTKVTKSPSYTHEGAKAKHITPEQELRRSVMSCLLWEDTFYEGGITIGERIENLCKQVSPEVISTIAVQARKEQNLRHVPLLLLKALLKTGAGSLVADTIAEVISRPDELAEFARLYWDGKNKKMFPNQMKKGLSRAFQKFNAYSLQKYNRDAKIKLRDVLFYSHAEPKDEEQGNLWKQLIAGTLPTPDTWETQLSGGADKKATFERLIREEKLGYFALLRNLRNMVQANCDLDLVREAIIKSKNGADKVLPFRYVAAARAAPQLEAAIDIGLQYRIGQMPELKGRTIVLVDNSGSMYASLSAKSDMRRADAAAALASIINGNVRTFVFSTEIKEVPTRKGMAGVDVIQSATHHASTNLGMAVNHVLAIPHDRLIVITDEQSQDKVSDPVVPNSYMINVASYKNGVGYGKWIHIDGFSENIIRWIMANEEYNG